MATTATKGMSARDLADKCADAYSTDAYGGSWLGCVRMLRRHGLTNREIEAVLRSKYTRWAGDAAGDRGKRYGRYSSRDLEIWMFEGPPNEFAKREGPHGLDDLVRGTFGPDPDATAADATSDTDHGPSLTRKSLPALMSMSTPDCEVAESDLDNARRALRGLPTDGGFTFGTAGTGRRRNANVLARLYGIVRRDGDRDAQVALALGIEALWTGERG